VAFSFVRPCDVSLVEPRPLLDLGCGDGQTALGLGAHDAFGVDRSIESLRAARASGLTRLTQARADILPFRDGTFRVVLAADLIHHVEDVAALFAEIGRVLRPGGILVAWWYAQAPHPAPGIPRFPRSYEDVAAEASLDVEPLDLEIVIGGGPPTVGLLGRR
jgi:SAM-dependent methyltransferase